MQNEAAFLRPHFFLLFFFRFYYFREIGRKRPSRFLRTEVVLVDCEFSLSLSLSLFFLALERIGAFLKRSAALVFMKQVPFFFFQFLCRSPFLYPNFPIPSIEVDLVYFLIFLFFLLNDFLLFP